MLLKISRTMARSGLLIWNLGERAKIVQMLCPQSADADAAS
jgi:hypothetical protein